MNLSKEHIQAVRNLINRYRTITLEEIKLVSAMFAGLSDHNIAKQELTGFGSTATCTLCASIATNCDLCIHQGRTRYGCCLGNSQETYLNIHKAQTPTKLRNAYRKRADYLEQLLNKTINNENKTI